MSDVEDEVPGDAGEDEFAGLPEVRSIKSSVVDVRNRWDAREWPACRLLHQQHGQPGGCSACLVMEPSAWQWLGMAF